MARAAVVSLRPHTPGLAPPRTFEDTVRDAARSSPYLTLSLVVHLALLLLFAAAPGHLPVPETPTLRGHVQPDPIAPPPPVETEPPPIEPLEDEIVDPIVSDDPSSTVEVGDEATTEGLLSFTGAESPGDPALIGVGLGDAGGSFGPPGGAKIGPRRLAGVPHDGVILAALRWLARHQEPDGHWSAAGFDGRCPSAAACDGLGQPQFDVGVTGLALLAFLGAGRTHRAGAEEEFTDTVRRGLHFLVREAQGPDGNFGQPGFGQHTYDHSIATLAVIEAWALTGDPQLRGPATRGLQHLARQRQPGGAWRYAAFHPEMALRPNDTSVTGWALLALTLGRDYGLPVDEAAIEDGLLFLDGMTDPQTGVTGYVQRGGRPAREGGADAAWPAGESESMTAVALLCRIFADPNLERPGALQAVERAAEVVAALPPVWDDARPGRRDYYFWYYGTTALFQVGGQRWKDWQAGLSHAVALQQRPAGGDAHGSWDPQHDPWGGQGGRVYVTALQTLTLEAFNRYRTVLGQHGAPRPR
ncbi:MAG: terpene cyclase/mutase family protein [Planctomycetes bacterium]|nr:terpene cyclase/mutase family protein [Planctomycetota bacterium]